MLRKLVLPPDATRRRQARRTYAQRKQARCGRIKNGQKDAVRCSPEAARSHQSAGPTAWPQSENRKGKVRLAFSIFGYAPAYLSTSLARKFYNSVMKPITPAESFRPDKRAAPYRPEQFRQWCLFSKRPHRAECKRGLQLKGFRPHCDR